MSDSPAQLKQAIEEFKQETGASSGEPVVALDQGLQSLVYKMYARLHGDVQRQFGLDSMVAPLSEAKAEADIQAEVELFQAVEVVDEVQQGEYFGGNTAWFLGWLVRLRMGEVLKDQQFGRRMAEYFEMSPNRRRLAFSNALLKVHPEASKSPLVLFQLLPLAARIMTALAFDQKERAHQLRARQLHVLPTLADCSDCRGALLPISNDCQRCGNPLWTFDWLNQ